MNFSQYQRLAKRTLQCEMTETELLANLVFGLCGESGEIADYLKKAVFHRHGLDLSKLSKELGDLLWYLSMIGEYYGLSLDDIAQQNIEKLEARYPEGFSYQDSQSRRDVSTAFSVDKGE